MLLFKKNKMYKFLSKRRTTQERMFYAFLWVCFGLGIVLFLNNCLLGLCLKNVLGHQDHFATSIKLLLLSFPVATYFWFVRDRDKQRSLFQTDYFNALDSFSSDQVIKIDVGVLQLINISKQYPIYKNEIKLAFIKRLKNPPQSQDGEILTYAQYIIEWIGENYNCDEIKNMDFKGCYLENQEFVEINKFMELTKKLLIECKKKDNFKEAEKKAKTDIQKQNKMSNLKINFEKNHKNNNKRQRLRVGLSKIFIDFLTGNNIELNKLIFNVLNCCVFYIMRDIYVSKYRDDFYDELILDFFVDKLIKTSNSEFRTLLFEIKREVDKMPHKKEIEKIEKKINHLHKVLIEVWEQNDPHKPVMNSVVSQGKMSSNAKWERFVKINNILFELEKNNFFIIDEDVKCVTSIVLSNR